MKITLERVRFYSYPPSQKHLLKEIRYTFDTKDIKRIRFTERSYVDFETAQHLGASTHWSCIAIEGHKIPTCRSLREVLEKTGITILGKAPVER